MAFNIPGVPSQLDARSMGNFDLGAALKSGFDNYKGFEEAKNTPAKLSEELLGKHLSNSLAKIKNQYAPQQAEAELSHLGAQTQGLSDEHGMVGLKQQLLQAQIAKALRSPQAPAEIQKLEWLLKNKDKFNQDNSAGMPSNEESQSYVQSLSADKSKGSQSSDGLDSTSNPYKYALNKAFGIPSELPHEKMQRELSTSHAKEQDKLDIKRAQQLRESAKDLELAGMDISGIHDILTGPDSLGTGITKTLVGKLGWGSEKLGAFNERTLRLQSQMTKALSSRGGVGAAKIVASGKPSTWKSTSENLGITAAYADRIKNEFDLLNQEYKTITGKELPYTLPEYVHNIGKKMIPTKSINGRTFELRNGEWHERKIRV